MSLTDMHIFVKAAESRTLTEAAERLNLPVSTISRAVKRIQADAKLVLLRRSADGLHLTSAGKDYWEACQRTLAAYQETLDILDTHRGEPQGKLHVYSPITFARNVLAPVLPQFCELYPKVHLELSIYCSNWHQEPSAEFDVFLKVRDPKDSRHHIKMFPPIRQGVFASATYLQGRELPAEPSDLQNHQCIGYSLDRRQVPWKLTREGEEMVLEPVFQMVVGDPDIQLDLTLSGVGVALLPLWAAHAATQRGELVRLLPQWTPEPIPFCALYRSRSRTSPKSEAFLRFLEHIIAKQDDPRLYGGQPSDFFELRS